MGRIAESVIGWLMVLVVLLALVWVNFAMLRACLRLISWN